MSAARAVVALEDAHVVGLGAQVDAGRTSVETFGPVSARVVK